MGEEDPFEILQPDPQGKKYALLVGVDDYEQIRDLKYAVADIKLIHDRLIDLDFKPENIQMLISGSDSGSRPIKRLIEEKINWILKSAQKDDMIFIAFAGHGMERNKTPYFLPEDLQPKQENFEETAVSLSQVMKQLSESPAIYKWMIVDACRDNPFPDRTMDSSERSLQNISSPPAGISVFQSCGEGETSFEEQDKGHGLFTFIFAEGLEGKADQNKDGKLTFLELCTYTTERTASESLRLHNKYQRPYLQGVMSDFVLIEDLLIEGITREKWKEANDLYKEACFLRRSKKYREARSKIEDALAIHGTKQEYQDEQTDIDWAIKNEEEKARLKEEKKLSDTAWDYYVSKEYDKALEKINAALELDPNNVSSKAIKKLIETAMKPPSPPVPPVTSPTGTSTVTGSLSEPGTEAGKEKSIDIKGVRYTFRWCPAGSFMMGSPESEEKRYNDETQHEVTLSKGFWMLETEVTQAMWKSVMGNNPSSFSSGGTSSSDVSGMNTDNFPVEKVSWHDCQKFCEKLNDLAEVKVTLPTEAQWEYACRAGTTGEYGGTGDLDDMGWYGHKEEYGDKLGNSGERTHEVKGKRPNAWGLYDMHGNVWEWCQDCYGSDYYKNSPSTDPTGPFSGSGRVDRGGGWRDDAEFCRSACRYSSSPGSRNDSLGFRLVLSSTSGR